MQKIWYVFYGFFVLLVLGFILTLKPEKASLRYAVEHGDTQIEYAEGKILNIQDGIFRVLLKPNSVDEADLEEISFEPDPDFLFNPYQVGDEVLLYKIEDETGVIYDVVDYLHLEGILYFFLLFSIVTIVIAKRKGFFSIVSLLVSTSLFYFVFLKGLQAGYSPLTACLVFVVSMTILTIPLIHGFNAKSASSLIAINLGFILSFFISLSVKSLVRLGEMPSEALRNLMIQLPSLDVGDVLLVILFLGAVGALIDTAVTVSSAIFEANQGAKKPNLRQSFKLGMEVGKDILGSMINTLLLAYLASSVPFFILLTYSKSTVLSDLMNFDFVAMEVTRTLIGAVSLVVLVPITAIVASWMLVRRDLGGKL